MERRDIPAWIAAAATAAMVVMVFFGGFATKDDLASVGDRISAVEDRISAVEESIDDLRDELRQDIRDLNRRIDNILLADRETPAQ